MKRIRSSTSRLLLFLSIVGLSGAYPSLPAQAATFTDPRPCVLSVIAW